MLTCPVATAVTTPPETVATWLLLVFQVATSVIGIAPLQVLAVAEIETVCGVPPTEMGALVGLSVIELIQPTVTVTVCVPETEGFCVAVAVTVAEPTATDVTKPFVLMVAMLPSFGLMLHETAGFPVLPSLNCPMADI